ncbi:MULTISPECIES: nitrite reductase [Shewanella]|uniref:nitrite reductase n=1 Tax=Shewanella TaxID=22 RepID=UPI00167890BE|nr:nitrite reductase [Shewanella fodinae]MCL2906124.1 nitrite reductase [Shewanella fodinae]
MFRNTWRTVLGVATLVCLLGFGTAGTANAETSTALKINDGPCLKCHKRNGTMLGVHGQDKMHFTCSTCHGEQGVHPRKPNDIRVFNPDPENAPQEQNKTCLRCHRPEKLAAGEWTHNVHANKVSCAACHQLHPATDPMTQMTGTQHSQLCRQCHAK